jgi:hypothetical protein
VKAKRIRSALIALLVVAATLTVGVAVGLAVITLGPGRSPVAEAPAATATAAPSPTSALPSATSGTPAPIVPAPTRSPDIALEMPVGNDCLACHTTAEGGVGSVPVPPIGHPLEGWGSCTSCHASDRLVATAPGHTGIHADQCLLCHKSTTPAAVDRPHSLTANSSCLSCHGSIAPLPDSMKGRSESTCFLCHKGTTAAAPGFPHRVPADGLCLTCHVASKVGALPADHADRTNIQSTACHGPATIQPPAAPHDLVAYQGMCAFCHGPSPKPSPGASPAASPTASP